MDAAKAVCLALNMYSYFNIMLWALKKILQMVLTGLLKCILKLLMFVVVVVD